MGLMSQLRGVLEDTKKDGLGLGNLGIPFNHSTGFDVLDYFIGGRDPENNDLHLGMAEGRIIVITGISGSGKTTLAIQIANNICAPFKASGDSGIFHFDFERSTKKSRIKSLINLTDKDMVDYYVHYDNIKINTEAVNETIKEIVAAKTAAPECMVTVEDSTGKPKKIYPPTVLLIDSWALMFPKKVLESEELVGGMTPASIARANNSLLKQTAGFLAAYNIIPIFINHITKKISIDPRKPNKAEINYLEQDESMPGGTSLYYMANTFLKVIPGAKLKPEEDYGFKGWISNIKIIKSRNSPAGLDALLVYDQKKGFNNLISTYQYLTANKQISGGGRASYIKGAENDKFTKKTFEDTYYNSVTLQEAFNNLALDNLEKIVPSVDVDEQAIEIPSENDERLNEEE